VRLNDIEALEDVFRVAFEHSAAGITVAAFTGEYVHANAAFCDFVGYTLEELRGMSIYDLMHPDDRSRASSLSDRLLSGNVPQMRWERRYVHKSGKTMWALLTTSVVRGDRDQNVFFLSQVIDINDKKHAEQALHESEDQLRQAQKMEAVGQLAGGIAHDFNNLLMAIMSNAELAALELPETSPAATHIDEIKSASRRARSLTQQLLAFSRKQMLQPRVLGMNAVVHEAEQILRRLIGENIIMTVRLDPSVGQVKADQGQVSQVLMNLAVNGRDAMPNGGELRIRTFNHDVTDEEANATPGLKPGQYVALRVEDTGYGMDDETKSRIFEPFFTTKPPGQGTGLGLSTAYGIVKQSGGYIGVESGQGTGSAFTILLPRVFQPADAVTSGAQPDAVTNGSKGTVLLVEDESSVREATKRMLRKFGFNVVEARNGQEALKAWNGDNDTIDVVLTDVVMPAMGGVELAQRLRDDQPDVKVVFMSGYTQGTLEPEAMDGDATRFLPKPFTAEQLVGTLSALIG
jgi:PAS domain S-box-containing protein